MLNATNPSHLSISVKVDEINQILERARRGDQSTLPALRKLLEGTGMVDLLGNMARQAEAAFIRAAAGENLAYKEAIIRKLELLRAELAGPNPTPIERLLVERVAACWLQVQDADMRYAEGCKNATCQQSEHHQRRMDRANRRYLLALKTLATVRKLAVPVLQVNIAGKQQVNTSLLLST